MASKAPSAFSSIVWSPAAGCGSAPRVWQSIASSKVSLAPAASPRVSSMYAGDSAAMGPANSAASATSCALLLPGLESTMNCRYSATSARACAPCCAPISKALPAHVIDG